MRELVALDLFIGINGCSLKTKENMQVMAEIPLERLMIETDAPWCDIRPTHASHEFIKTKHAVVNKPEKWEEGKGVKGRNEPCAIVQVLEAICGYRGLDLAETAEQVYLNTARVFFPNADNGNTKTSIQSAGLAAPTVGFSQLPKIDLIPEGSAPCGMAGLARELAAHRGAQCSSKLTILSQTLRATEVETHEEAAWQCCTAIVGIAGHPKWAPLVQINAEDAVRGMHAVASVMWRHPNSRIVASQGMLAMQGLARHVQLEVAQAGLGLEEWRVVHQAVEAVHAKYGWGDAAHLLEGMAGPCKDSAFAQ